MEAVLVGQRTDIDVRCANCNTRYEYERGIIKNLDAVYAAVGLKC